jgi:asparagine synthase (glutamine-hydrolysing)
MPGIFGIVTPQVDPAAPVELAQAARLLARRPAHRTELQGSGPATLGSVRIDGEPRLARAGDDLLAYCGEIVTHPAELRARFDDRELPERVSLAELLLALFQAAGPDSLTDLNGLYALAVWQAASRTLTLINDRYGLQKLYIWQSGERFVFSSEMKLLLGLPGPRPALDRQSAAELLALGYSLDDRTLFEGVRLLAPATRLTVRAGQTHPTRTWEPPFRPPTQVTQPVRALVDGLAERAKVAVATRLHPNSCLLLTGGLDSRLIAGMASRLGLDPPLETLTLGQENAADVLAAREIAAALGLPFTHLPIAPDYLARYAAPTAWLTEGNMNAYAGWILAANEHFVARGTRYALTGIGGEVVSGRHRLLEGLDPNPERAVQQLVLTSWFAQASEVLRPELNGLLSEAQSSLCRTVKTAPAEHPLDRLDWLSLTQTLRRHATSVDVFADTVHPLDPLLDNVLVDYALAIPPELRARAYLYRRALLAHLPEIATLGDSAAAPLPPQLDLQVQTLNSLAVRARRRIKRSLLGRPPSPADRQKGNIRPNAWLRGPARLFVESVLAETELLADLVEPRAVLRLLADHMQGRRNEYAILSGLVTLALWRKQFEFSPGPLVVADLA